MPVNLPPLKILVVTAPISLSLNTADLIRIDATLVDIVLTLAPATGSGRVVYFKRVDTTLSHTVWLEAPVGSLLCGLHSRHPLQAHEETIALVDVAPGIWEALSRSIL